MHEVARFHQADPEWAQFASFTLKHNRNYPTVAEVNERFTIFKENMAKNVILAQQNPLATFGVNKFSDMSSAEFRSKYLMPVNFTQSAEWQADRAKMPKWKPTPLQLNSRGVPNDVDWCAQGYCTPVKDQGQCGSCWAFSTAETIESSTYATSKNLPVLAPEQIVDCDSNDSGCNGGIPRSAMSWVQSNGGLDTEASYPYTAGQSGQAGQCQTSGTVGATCSGPQDVSDGDEGALQSFLQSTGPPSVCVDASSWQSYTGGVLTTCGTNVDHAVQATGIDSTQGTPAYIVRNSWNTDWGVNGFIYLAMNMGDMCQVASQVTWAQTP